MICAVILRFADYPLAPLLIGFILGRMLEDNFARSMQLYDGFGFVLERPMTLGLLVSLAAGRGAQLSRAPRAQTAEGVADGD